MVEDFCQVGSGMNGWRLRIHLTAAPGGADGKSVTKAREWTCG